MSTTPSDGPHVEPHIEPSEEARGVDRELLDKAIGGWRGVIDSGLPAVVFVCAFVISGQQLRPSVVAALAAGGVIALVRLQRREPLTQVGSGFLGVAVSAFVATRTGRAEDFFLMGILINAAYFAAFLVSALVRWPLIGVVGGVLMGEGREWRSEPSVYRAFATVTWLWVGMFGLRLAVQLPLYLTSSVELLGFAKVLLGWPLFLLTAFVSYRVLHPVLTAHRHESDGSQKAVVPDA